MQNLGGTTAINAEDNQRVRDELMDCVATQVNVLETNELFVSVFMWIILVHFISVALIIGIGSINLLLVGMNLNLLIMI